MDERNEISVELSALSALVGGISRQTPYGAPVGYFEELPAVVMSRIASELMIFPAAGMIFPAAASTFQVPEGYFDRFAANILARINAGTAAGGGGPGVGGGESVDAELARLSPAISAITREMPYRLPEGYFEELSPVLAVLRDKPAYAVPQGYFDELSPVLTVAQDGSTYQVPEGYFAELSGRILEKVTEPVAAAKVIPMARVIADSRENMHRESVRSDGGKVLKGH